MDAEFVDRVGDFALGLYLAHKTGEITLTRDLLEMLKQIDEDIYDIHTANGVPPISDPDASTIRNEGWEEMLANAAPSQWVIANGGPDAGA